MPRTKQVLLRLTEEEHALLKQLAGREPVSSYLRRMALGEHEPMTPEASAALKAAWESPALVEQFNQGPRALEAEEIEAVHQHLQDKYLAQRKTPKKVPYARCTAKGCTFTSANYPARCPKHGFSHVELS